MNIMDLNSDTVTVEHLSTKPDEYSIKVNGVGLIGIIKAKKGKVSPERVEKEMLEKTSLSALMKLAVTKNSLYEVSVRYNVSTRSVLVRLLGKHGGHEEVFLLTDTGTIRGRKTDWELLNQPMDSDVIPTSLKINYPIICENGPILIGRDADCLCKKEGDIIHYFQNRQYKQYDIVNKAAEKTDWPDWVKEYDSGNDNAILPHYGDELREILEGYGDKGPIYQGKNLFVTCNKDVWVLLPGGWIPLGTGRSYLSSMQVLGEDYLQEYFVYRATVE